MATPDLDSALESIKRWAAQNDLPVVFGYFAEDGFVPSVLYHDDHEGQGLEHYLQIALRLGARAIFVNVTRLDEVTWRSRAEEFIDARSSNQEVQIKVQVEESRSSIGKVAAIELRALAVQPQVLLKLDVFADWFDLFYAREEAEDQTGESEEEREDPVHLERVERLARELAEAPEFARAKNQDQRDYVARKLLSSRAEEAGVSLSDILAQATSIYQVEVKPMSEAALLQQALLLRKQGLTMAEISDKLRMPATKIQSLLRGR